MEQSTIKGFKERIGDPSLFCGRKREMKLLTDWANGIPKERSKSRVILARRKSGKTAIMQRLFNNLWRQKGPVIPFYIEVHDVDVWALDFARLYFSIFLSHYLSFKTRKTHSFEGKPWALSRLKKMGEDVGDDLVTEYIDEFSEYFQAEQVQNALNLAFTAPHTFAIEKELSFLVIIDEIQYMTQYIYWDKERKIRAHNLPGMFHGLSESKVAPMLVSGSYIGWMVQMIGKMFVGGRLKGTELSPKLEKKDGLEAVYRYADYYDVPISDESAQTLNELTQSDPFYITGILKSDWEFRDFSTPQGVIKTVEYEILNRKGEIFETWSDYIRNTISEVNDVYTKKILLFLSKERDREHTRVEISAHLNDRLPEHELEEKLRTLLYGDLITRGASDFRYRGIKDDILDLIFRLLYQEEIDLVEPDIGGELTAKIEKLEKENRSLSGAYRELKGRLLEFIVFRELNKLSKTHQPISNLLNRLRPRLTKDQAETATARINEMGRHTYDRVWMNFQLQQPSQSPVEFDVFAGGSEGGNRWAILFEIKNRDHKHPPTQKEAETFAQKVIRFKEVYDPSAEQTESTDQTFTVFPIYLSAKGFQPEVEQWLQSNGIHTADFDTWHPV